MISGTFINKIVHFLKIRIVSNGRGEQVILVKNSLECKCTAEHSLNIMFIVTG